MWKKYRDNAIEHLESAKVLLDADHFTTAYECGFFAVEILFKAWMVRSVPELAQIEKPRRQDDPLFTHNLKIILRDYAVLDGILSHGCPREYNLLLHSIRDQNRWQPWKRYRYQASLKIAQQQYKLAEGLHKWMLSNLLTP